MVKVSGGGAWWVKTQSGHSDQYIIVGHIFLEQLPNQAGFSMQRLIEKVCSNDTLEQAFLWVQKRRVNYSHNSDIWDLCWRWKAVKQELQAELPAGRYHLSPLKEYRFPDGNRAVWSAQDAVVLKALTIVLEPYVEMHAAKECTHLAGHGGSKSAVQAISEQFKNYSYFIRTDVQSYYASIEHDLLLEQIIHLPIAGNRQLAQEPEIIELLDQYMRYSVEFGGVYRDNNRGICLGCPLSPLMGALFLKPIDEAFSTCNLFYRRYMDDWVILAKSRWQLKRAIKTMNQILDQLKLTKHPDKTEMGHIEKGFDFLGYHLRRDGIRAASKTLANAVSKATRLYEQGASDERIGEYWTRFLRWLQAGISDDIPRPALPISNFRAMDDQPLQQYCLIFQRIIVHFVNLQYQLICITVFQQVKIQRRIEKKEKIGAAR